MTPDPPPVSLLTPEETAARIGRSRTAVYALIRSGELEVVRFGQRTTRIPSDSIDAYIERYRGRQWDRSRHPEATP